MTSTPISGSAGIMMTGPMTQNVNQVKTGKKDFQDFLDASSNTEQSQVDNVKSIGNVKEEKEVEKTEPEKEMVQETEETKPAEETKEVSEEETDAVKDAVEEIKEIIKEEMNVTDEDIVNVLETLGFNPLALLDTTKLPQIVAKLSDSDDVLSLATDSKLFDSLTKIEDKVEMIVSKLSETLEVEELPEAIKKFSFAEKTETPSFDRPVEDNGLLAKPEVKKTVEPEEEQTFEGKITVNVSKERIREHRETFKRETTEVTAPEETIEISKEENEEFTNSQNFNQNSFSSMAERIIEKVTQTFNESSEVQSFTTIDTTDVINQITESIKIDLTADTSEISLKLHPESLGNVSVKVTANHEGVLTAQFTAQNESVKAIIESQAVVLKESLENKGVTVEAVEVLVQSHEFERNLSQEGKNNSSENRPARRGIRRINLAEADEDILEDEDKVIKEMMAQNGNTVDYSV